METLLLRFEDYLKMKGKSEQTISSYVLHVKRYIEWYYKKFQSYPSSLYEENILSFKQFLVQEMKSASTVNIYLHALRTYNEFLIEENQMDTSVVKRDFYQQVQSDLTSPAKFESAEIERFYQTILNDDSRNQKYTYRGYIIAKIMGLAGLRISEVLSLTIDDIIFDSKEILVRNGKGDKTRTVLMNQELSRLLQKYLKQTRPLFSNSDFTHLLFLNRTGKPLSRKTVYDDFKKYSDKLGLSKSLSPHDLRHHFCSRAINNGLDVHEVAYLAGHASVQTTLRYTHVSRKQLLDKLDKL